MSDGKLRDTRSEGGFVVREERVRDARPTDRDLKAVVEDQEAASEAATKAARRSEDDTIRHTLTEVASKVDIDVAEAAKHLQESAARADSAARSLLLESRRTRMASRPGMKRPFIK